MLRGNLVVFSWEAGCQFSISIFFIAALLSNESFMIAKHVTLSKCASTRALHFQRPVGSPSALDRKTGASTNVAVELLQGLLEKGSKRVAKVAVTVR